MQRHISLDDGRVTLDAPLGEGGMGTVFCGRLRGHEGPVAVKLLRVEGLDPAERATLAARLRDEAAAAARVVHPNLVRILASGDCPVRGPYIVYELVEGGSLEARLTAGPLPWEEVEERLAPQLLGALGALHDAGVVHRDVKPDNIFVTPDGRYLLGDLGLAVFDGRSAATATGVVVGTPGYLAPERFTAPDAAPTSAGDVYAAAMVLVRAAAGRLPFTAVAPAALIREQLTRAPSAAGLEARGIPAGPARILAAAIDPDPAARPDSPGELLARLHAAPGDLPTPGAAAGTRWLRATRNVAVADARPGQAGSRRRLWPLLTLALALLVGVTAHRSGVPPHVEVPSGRIGHGGDATAALVHETRPLVPDLLTERARVSSPDELRDIVRTVSLGLGTTTSGAVAFQRLFEDASSPQIMAAASGYAAALRSAEPSRAATGTLLLTSLLARGELRSGLPDDLALAVFDVLAHLPPSGRDGAAGRSLALTLDLLLVQDIADGPPPPALEALSLALTAPDLTRPPRLLGAALGLQVAPPAEEAAFRRSLESFARPALRRERFADLQLLEPDKIYRAFATPADSRAQVEMRVRAASGRVVEDWYRMAPAAYFRPYEPPPAPVPAVVRSAGVVLESLVRVRRAIVRLDWLSGVSSGPFRPGPLAGRLGLVMRQRAERAAEGCREGRSTFLRDVDELVLILDSLGGDWSASFLDPIDAVLARAPSCRSALLTLRGERRLLAKDRPAAARLASEAVVAALDAVDRGGADPVAHDVDALRYALVRWRYGRGELGDEPLRGQILERTRAVVVRLETDPAVSAEARGAARPLREELTNAQR